MMDSILPNHRPALTFSLSDLQGYTQSLADTRGRIGILNFRQPDAPGRRDGTAR